MRLNLADVEVKDYEAIPAGKYIVKFTDYEEKTTKGGADAKLPAGTPMINWEMTVLRHIDGTDTYKNRKVWMNTILHEKTMFNLKGLLIACGYTDEQLANDIEFVPDDIIGHEVLARVVQREYPKDSGDYTNDVRSLKPVGSEQAESAASLLP